MGEWNESCLGEIVSLITKGTTPTTLGVDFTIQGVNYIKSEAISYDGRIDKSLFVHIDEQTHQKLKRSQIQRNDILFTIAGVFLGKNAIVSNDMLPANTNQAVAIIRVDEGKADVKFVHYFLRQKSTIELVNNFSAQSAQPNINFQEIRSIRLLMPLIAEQRAIAEVLSSLDDKIDLLQRQNKTLESLAAAYFRQWFVEDANGDTTTVSSIAELANNNENPLRKPMEVFNHYSIPAFDAAQMPTVELGKSILSNKFVVLPNTILVSKLNPSTPRIWRISKVIPNSVCSTEFQVLKPKDKKHYLFMYFLMQSSNVISSLAMSATGTSGSHQRIRPEYILEIEMAEPSDERLMEFNEMFLPMMKKVDENNIQITTLKNLRDTLLPKLISGEVRVKMEAK